MSEKAPNILLITSDQHHHMCVGYNNPRIKTPNLDRLAARGMVFDRAYTCNPTCTPTRASMITGRYPSQHGAYSLGTKLPETELTVGEVMAAHGYRTALVGKAHFQPLRGSDEFPSLESYPIMQNLDYWRDFHGPFYGFDHVELARNHTDEAHVGQHYALWMESTGCRDWRKYFQPPTGDAEAQLHAWNIPEELHYNTWIAERTNALLKQYSANGERFFLWASFFDPHPSYLVPEPWANMYDPANIEVPQRTEGEHALNPPHFQLAMEDDPDFSGYAEEGGNACHGFHSHAISPDDLAKNTAVYYGMITMMDKYIGQILDTLEDCGLAEDTVAVFTTDHGHYLGQHGLIAKGPFHYDDLIRVPLVCSWPRHIEQDQRTEAMFSLVDLAPTLLTLVGVDVPRCMTGVDQSAVWLGRERKAREAVIVEDRHQPTTINVKTYVTERYKLSVYCRQTYGQLYDMQGDPGEVRNLWDDPACAELKSRLLLEFLHAEMGKEPLLMPRIAGA